MEEFVDQEALRLWSAGRNEMEIVTFPRSLEIYNQDISVRLESPLTYGKVCHFYPIDSPTLANRTFRTSESAQLIQDLNRMCSGHR